MNYISLTQINVEASQVEAFVLLAETVNQLIDSCNRLEEEAESLRTAIDTVETESRELAERVESLETGIESLQEWKDTVAPNGEAV